jgi:hypothetical protein
MASFLRQHSLEKGGVRPSLRALKISMALSVVALVVAGQIIFFVGAVKDSGPALVTGNTPALHGSVPQKLRTILAVSLGPSHRGADRFKITKIQSDTTNPRLKVVDIRWSIGNDLSAGSVGNGAQIDVLAMLQGIFTARLPIEMVRLDGTYPVRNHVGQSVETTVMKLSMDRHTANLISRSGWGNMDPQTLWPLVDRRFVANDFQPIASE